MKKIIFIIFLFALNICNCYCKEEVKFYSCVDGDTFKIKKEDEILTVRMLAIDTPESVHPKKKLEYYGKEASDFTCNKLKNAKKIEIESDDNSDLKDKYNRLLSYVYVDDYLLQEMLVSEGYAEVAYLYGDYKYAPLLKDKQSVAVALKKGIWDEEKKSKWESNENDEKIGLKEIILLILLLVVAYFYKLFNKKIKKLKKQIKI